AEESCTKGSSTGSLQTDFSGGTVTLSLSSNLTGRFVLRNPVQRGHPIQRKADGNPVIADSR
ncbi:MAG: hypothetical protein ACLQF1_01200, partial [Methyloceanibacter sp.]